ncbi:hypothetical protein JCM6882_002899 [Rhodosporidiobolus microsporus]
MSYHQPNHHAPAPSQTPYYSQQQQQYGAHAPQPPQRPPSHGGPPAPPARYDNRPGHQQGGYGQGGYGQQAPPPPPSRASVGGGPNAQLWAWFTAVDVDRSGAISEVELKQALVNGDWSQFSDETVKMLMTMFDVDRSGTIGFDEFVGLWQYIKEWQGIFRQFDRDGSGTMDSHELSIALSRFGYQLSPQLIQLLQKKYSPLQGNPGAAPPGITFAVKQLSEGFKKHDQDRDGWIQINYEQFMSLVLAAP